MWLWCASLAGAALATRFVPFREGGEWHLWESLAVLAIGLFAVRAPSMSCIPRDRELANPGSAAASVTRTKSRERLSA